MSQATEYNFYLYADDSWSLCQHKKVTGIKKQVAKDFSNICDWFVDNKLNIYFKRRQNKLNFI